MQSRTFLAWSAWDASQGHWVTFVLVTRSTSVPTVSVIVAIPCLVAAFEHFLQPLRRNQALDTLADCWPHNVISLLDFRDK